MNALLDARMTRDAKPWQFWLPQSGRVGSSVMSVVVVTVILGAASACVAYLGG